MHLKSGGIKFTCSTEFGQSRRRAKQKKFAGERLLRRTSKNESIHNVLRSTGFVKVSNNMSHPPLLEDLQRKLVRDEEWLRDIKNSLAKSEQLRDNIGLILDNFQERIGRVSDTITPLYQKTNVIQRKQQNVKKLLNIIDASIQFYGKTMELENFVRDGAPAQNLDAFLEKMDGLNEAITFFNSHNAYETQQENMKQTFDAGCTCLESEFGTAIKNESVILNPMDLIQCLNDDYEVMSFRLTGMKTIKNYEKLNRIAKWCIQNTNISQLAQKYAKVRSENILKVLNSLVDQQKKMDKEKNFYYKHAFLSALKKAAGRGSERQDADVQKDAPINQALLQLAGFLILAQLETDVCTLIFEDVKEVAIVFRETIARPLRSVLEKCSAIIDSYGGSFSGLLLMAKFLLKNATQLQTLAENVQEGPIFVSFNRKVFRESSNSISDFTDKLSNDHNKFVPEDGNVHQVTANTVSFLKMLAKEKMTVSKILEMTVGSSRSNSDAQFSKLFAQILATLGGNLRNKAATYQDEYLSAFFMLNNLNYVHECLQNGDVRSILAEQNDQLSNFYRNEINDYLTKYMRSWGRIRFTLQPSSIDKKSIKTCFANFNKEFDSVVETQKIYCVADVQMARDIRRKIKEEVLKPYQEFCNKHSNSYSVDRQMKYDVESVDIIIDRLFDSST